MLILFCMLIFSGMMTAFDEIHDEGKAQASSFVFHGVPQTLLLAGLDHDPQSSDRDRRTDLHTDSLVLLYTNAGSRTVNALHIPRDTLVYLPNVGVTKINAVRMFYGDLALRRAVQNLTGIPVNAVLYADFPRFKKAFYQLGHVAFYVDRTINSPEGNVHLRPGLQALSPEEALAVARFRHEPLGDVGRVQRQARLLHAAINDLHRLPYPAYAAILKTLDPVLTPDVISQAYAILHRMNAYHAYMLPGRFGEGREFGDFVADHQGMRAVREALIDASPNAGLTPTWRHQLDARDVGRVQIL